MQLLMAAAIFEATLAVVLPVAKVPMVALVQLLLPSQPAVTPLQVKLLTLPPSVMLLLELPGVVLVIVTTPAFAVAVTPTAEYELSQLLMAAARYAARVAGVELAAKLKLPALALVHAPEPLNPGIEPWVPADQVSVKASWLEVVVKTALLPEVLIKSITTPVPGDAKVAETLGFGAVIYE